MVLASLHICADLSAPSLLDDAISTEILCADPCDLPHIQFPCSNQVPTDVGNISRQM